MMIGKTTVARKMGEVFYHLGLLPSSDVIDISAQDLVTGYLGQSGKKTAEILSQSRGKVLFIDEAYQLNPSQGGQYMQEVVDEIVRSLTLTEMKGNLVLILAGYEQDIDDMLSSVNQGLRSRITKKIYFPNFNQKKIIEMLLNELKKKGFECSDSALEELPGHADELSELEGFSNGRDIETLSKRIMTNTLRRREKIISKITLSISFDQLITEIRRSTTSKSAAAAIVTEGVSRTTSQSKQPMLMPVNESLAPPPTKVTRKQAVVMESRVEEVLSEEEVATAEEEEEEEDPSDLHRQAFLQSLQDLLDEQGWNSKKGIEKLLNLSPSQLDTTVALDIAQRLGIDLETVREMLKKWKESQREMLMTLEEAERELEKMKKTKNRGLVPIWRCGACGRADKTYIACYVAPYVVRYEERDLN
jgi:hypothetical protein